MHTHARAKFREDATRGERQKLETIDLAREFDLSRPSDFEV